MDDLTTPEIHNWYNNIVKRFGWIALSANDKKKTDNFKDEIGDLIKKTERKVEITTDIDKRNDLNTMALKLRELSGLIDVIKGGGVTRRRYKK
jgi:hypothetical protein